MPKRSASKSSSSGAKRSKRKREQGEDRGGMASGKGELESVRELVKSEMDAWEKQKHVTLQSLGLEDKVSEAMVMPAETVGRRIENLVIQTVNRVLQGQGMEFKVPTRSTTNQMYIAELDRIALKRDKYSLRNFANTREVKKATITARVMQLIHTVLGKNIHITKRDLFYTDVKLFVDQAASDGVLDDVACMLGCTRTSLNVVASEKGIVVGKLKFRDDGDPIDCSRMGVGGKAIPPFTDRITDLESTAEFILLVEKDAAFMRLAEDRFYNQFPCIIITAKGQPDVATRMFLKRLREELGIPVLGLVDSDPYGLKILSVYMSGSKNMSYDSSSLTTHGIKWLGVRPSDLDRYKIPDQCRLKMTENDIKTGKALLNEDFIQKNPEWIKELEIMLKTKEKAEIQALSSFGFQYLTQTYLPEKIKRGDWI